MSDYIIRVLRAYFGITPRKRRASYRPQLTVLEDRLAPADCVWVGTGNGNGAKWSVAANWHNNTVPGKNDVAIFDGTQNYGSNAECTMDLGGNGVYHLGKMIFSNNYNKTLTLSANLIVDVLDMRSAATITSPAKFLQINQSTPGALGATMFGTSKWFEGTMSVDVKVTGEEDHQATLLLGSVAAPDLSVRLNKTLTIGDTNSRYASVEWVGGSVTVPNTGKVVNFGNFLADSPNRTMGNVGGNNDRWTFENFRDVRMGKGQLRNVRMEAKQNGREFKVSTTAPGADRFDVEGEYLVTHSTNELTVESGILAIDGDFSLSDGAIAVEDSGTFFGNSLRVTGSFAQSGGAVLVEGSWTTFEVGSFDQTGGTATVEAGKLDADTTSSIGGTLYLRGATLEASGGVEIVSGGVLDASGTVVLMTYGAGLLNGGTLVVGGTGTTGTLSITGDYEQTSAGVLKLEILDATNYDRLVVTGAATLDGTLEVTLLGDAPEVDDHFDVLSYGSRTGTFGTLDLPFLPSGTWDPRYDDPFGLSLWVE